MVSDNKELTKPQYAGSKATNPARLQALQAKNSYDNYVCLIMEAIGIKGFRVCSSLFSAYLINIWEF